MSDGWPWGRVLEMQHLIDAAGGVPADIPLFARVDCLIKQRDGQAPIVLFPDCCPNDWDRPSEQRPNDAPTPGVSTPSEQTARRPKDDA